MRRGAPEVPGRSRAGFAFRKRAFPVAVAALAVAAAGRAPAEGTDRRLPSLVDCALLDQPKIAGRMAGLQLYLAKGCGREELLGGGEAGAEQSAGGFVEPLSIDVPVSSPAADGAGVAGRTQSETAIAASGSTGTICAAWNDAYHGIFEGTGFSGFGRSTDGGLTFEDRGALSLDDSGGPSLVWRAADQSFYYAALRAGGIGVYRSSDDCRTFQFVRDASVGLDDREMMTVDNHPGSPYFGALYIVWTDFGLGGQIRFTRSIDGGATWESQLSLSEGMIETQAAWPAVAPDGDIYVAWMRWTGTGFPNGTIEIDGVKSTDGGLTFSPIASPMGGRVGPRDAVESEWCGRPALGGRVRHLPAPTVAVDGAGRLHVVYSYDPDGFDIGDESNVYYRRSIDGGDSWEREILVNDDGGITDQWQPTLAVSPAGEAGQTVTISYYSRQNDIAGNMMFDAYSRASYDGGVSFAPSVRLSDESSPVVLDGLLARCYHGDYDTQIQFGGAAHLLWSDDRDPDAGGELAGTPNIYAASVPTGTDFLVVPDPARLSVCAGGAAVVPLDVLQFAGFVEPVTLSATGNPGATSVAFDANPVVPPGGSSLTVGDTGGQPFGTAVITVEGISAPSAIERSSRVELTFHPAPPAPPELVQPADGATGQFRQPTFVWSAVPGAETYRIEIATDSAFTDVVREATVQGTTWKPALALAMLTSYSWRVTAKNPCGETVSATSTFTTALPGVLLVDDDDDSPNVASAWVGALEGLEVFDRWDVLLVGKEPTAADLAPYRAIVWFSGNRYTGASEPTAGPQSAAEAALRAHLQNGACLLISSQDYLWDMGGFTHDVPTPFMASHLGVATGGDSSDYDELQGVNLYLGVGDVGLSFSGPNYSDRLIGTASARFAMVGSGPAAALRQPALSVATPIFITTFLGFALELSSGEDQKAVMRRFLDLCGELPVLFADDFEDATVCDWDSDC